jgi:hypothetical protein
VAYIFPFAHRSIEIFSNRDPKWIVLCAAILGTRLQGFADAVVFGSSPVVRKRWSEFIEDAVTLEWKICGYDCCAKKKKKRTIFNPLIEPSTSSSSQVNHTTDNRHASVNSATSKAQTSSKGSSYFSFHSGGSRASPAEESRNSSVDIEIYTGVSYPGLFEKLEERNRDSSLWSRAQMINNNANAEI